MRTSIAAAALIAGLVAPSVSALAAIGDGLSSPGADTAGAPWALMLAGLAGLGLLGRHSHRRAAPAPIRIRARMRP